MSVNKYEVFHRANELIRKIYLLRHQIFKIHQNCSKYKNRLVRPTKGLLLLDVENYKENYF